MFFFCKQKTAYDLRISDWSSDVCSSDLVGAARIDGAGESLDRGEGEFGEAAALDIVDQAVGDVGSGLEPVDHQRPEILGSGARLAGKRLHFLRDDGESAPGFAGAGCLEIGRAHVCTPVTNAHLVCRLRLENKTIHHNV